ncbi:MAG TPA: TetR/AcrR family transcriptional regulator [Acidimicrobiales bacterium]|nr:TetR/AcrR family transcriptional regulator [Acidimicrobiales bacterium]
MTMIDRRSRRRQETIDEILAIAEDLMNVEGVNGLSLSEVARRLGVKPPSVYKYFDSLLAIYDALFARAMESHLEAMRDAMASAAPGLAALAAGLEASGRWCLAHPGVAQLLFWRPVPRFEPSPEAMAPSVEMVQLQRAALHDAVRAGELGSAADSDHAVWTLSVMVSGVIGQTLANEPDLAWGEGRFSPLLRELLTALPALFPPKRRARA